MKVSWPGGAPVPLGGDAPFPLGGAWSRSGEILFGPHVVLAGLYRIPAGVGQAEVASVLEIDRGDTTHAWPVVLPDGRHVLYFVRSVDDARRGIYALRLDQPAAGTGTLLFRSDSQAIYTPLPGTSEGALLYVTDGRIEVRRLDPDRMTLVGDARSLGLSAAGTTLANPMMVSASRDLLAFADRTPPYGSRLTVVARNGELVREWDAAEAENWPRVSPDGRRLVRQRVHELHNNPDLWVEDLERGPLVRVTTDPRPDIFPVWSPDGRYLAYVSGSPPGGSGERTLTIGAADGTGVVRRFPCPTPAYCEPTDWTDQRLLVNVVETPDARDVWIVSATDGSAQPLLAEAFAEQDARFAPGQPWIAYTSSESGRSEVSLRSLSEPRQRIVVSSDGGTQPVWRRDGAELFFVDLQGRLRAVAVQWRRDGTVALDRSLDIGIPAVAFGHWGTQYDVSPDGSLFYMMSRTAAEAPREIHVVYGWSGLLR